MNENTKNLINDLNDKLFQLGNLLERIYNQQLPGNEVEETFNKISNINEIADKYVSNFNKNAVGIELRKDNVCDIFIESSMLYIIEILSKKKITKFVNDSVLKCLKFFAKDVKFKEFFEILDKNEGNCKYVLVHTKNIVEVIKASSSNFGLNVLIDVAEYVIFKKAQMKI